MDSFNGNLFLHFLNIYLIIFEFHLYDFQDSDIKRKNNLDYRFRFNFIYEVHFNTVFHILILIILCYYYNLLQLEG